MKRAFAFLFLLLFAAPLWAAPALSLREIGGVDVGFVEDSGFSISPDGRYLAVLSTPGEKGSDCTVIERRTHKFWDVPGAFRMEPLTWARTGHALWIWGLHGDEPLPGAPQVKRDEAFIALYNPAKRRYRFALTGDVEDWDVPSDTTLSRDGRTLIFSSQDGWVRGFSTRTGRQKWKKRAIDKGDVPVNVALAPDGKRALRFPDDDGKTQTTQIIATRSGRVLQTLKLPLRGGLMSAFDGGRFAPRGDMVAVFKPDDQSWNFFDGRSGRWQWKMGHDLSANRSDLEWVWSPDARRIAVSGPNGFELRDANDGRVLSSSAHLRPQENASPWVGSLVFSPDGKLIYSLGGSDTGFGTETVLWQLRINGTRAQRRADKFWFDKTRAAQAKFALSPKHIDQSLIQAARAGDSKRVAFLLDRGAHINARGASGFTPLVSSVFSNDVYAGAHHYEETTKLLLERGASAKPMGGGLLADAAVKGNIALVRDLLRHGAQVNSDARSYGPATALHAAAGAGQLQIVRLLIAAGANVNAPGDEGTTPLFNAASVSSYQGVQIARLLLDAGAGVNARTAKIPDIYSQQTALQNAAGYVNARMVELLLERGADPNTANSVGQTPLMAVVQANNFSADKPAHFELAQLKTMRALLAHGADARATNAKGESALDLAVSPELKKLLNARK